MEKGEKWLACLINVTLNLVLLLPYCSLFWDTGCTWTELIQMSGARSMDDRPRERQQFTLRDDDSTKLELLVTY